ncbi:hypothetical protein HID58_089409 [Brassica napus]|uniref:MATH domain-containing protein n=1 Tax=Brassica napus TaxID=3708 RepID=A0ABQ7Y1F2_BRANA|nr:hypothetical protein HID58_089409 [Brassica napus]
MENQKQTSCFSFEIDNFWEKINAIRSPRFLSGGCEWFVELYPKGMIVEDHYVSLFLFANPETLRLGWKRRASFSFILLNQSGKELGRRRPEFCERLFCAYCTGWGRSKELPLKKLKEKGSLENSKLIVKVEIQVHEVVDEGGITGKEMVDVWGFRVFIYLLHGCFFILFPDFNIYIFAHVDNNDRLFQCLGFSRHTGTLQQISDKRVNS